MEGAAADLPIVAQLVVKAGTVERGRGRMAFASVTEALEFEQAFNSALPAFRVHLRPALLSDPWSLA